ncbi:MAG: hypothetical protein A2428_05465 [Bdellovibrionales bacterium RIFOXYC1_FULL_54_43]|nr:MAG: hypothetical protein A2428_05465 [Bdellovibrionales bacterium RIFOXYC1_FULL_54_43]OFZ80975.1 MAG: hypothetical protein A2603_16390 [Bdellovibrionales bacterium RIFOXYD1_FULL_55_31]
MNRAIILFLGVLATFISALFGINLIPKLQIDTVRPEGTLLPYGYSELAARGRKIYIREGCLYCHTQQVRPKQDGSDIPRGLGMRQTAVDDYVHDNPIVLGTSRTGPDLMNIGIRQPSDEWHLLHLYNPRIVSQGSVMPSFPWLFKEQVTAADTGVPLKIPDKFMPKNKRPIIPTDEALALVEYLKSLKRDYKVKGVP